MLSHESTARHGFKDMRDLAESGNAKAMFLLSRLYFHSGEESDNVNTIDSLANIRQWLGIEIDNATAHKMLVQAVTLDHEDYRAEYELGCDYKSNRRGTTRQNDSAYIHLNSALMHAKMMGDKEYTRKIADKMSNLEKPSNTKSTNKSAYKGLQKDRRKTQKKTEPINQSVK